MITLAFNQFCISLIFFGYKKISCQLYPFFEIMSIKRPVIGCEAQVKHREVFDTAIILVRDLDRSIFLYQFTKLKFFERNTLISPYFETKIFPKEWFGLYRSYHVIVDIQAKLVACFFYKQVVI